MTKTLRNKWFIVFIAVLFVCSVVIAVLTFANYTASASDTYVENEFSVQNDASIRLLGESGNGIRFTVKLGSATYESSNNGANLGILIFPSKYLTDSTNANYYSGTDYINVVKKLNFEPGTYSSNNVQLADDGYYYCSASITDLHDESCSIDFVAVAYIRSGAEGSYTYSYSTISAAQSVVDVVEEVYASSSYFGGDDAISDGYIDNYRSVLESYYERGVEELKSSLLGLGSEVIPYLIRSDADWSTLASEVEAGESFQGKKFRLTQDIAISSIIGSYTDAENNRPFAGILDGNVKTITASINHSGNYAGLVAYNKGIIKNIITAPSSTEGESVVGAISGADYVGGIVAVNEGIVVNCTNKADIIANAQGAGIIAFNLSSEEIIGCVNEGSVSIKGNVGAGIIAKNYAHAVITNCNNSGTITYTENTAAGEKIAGFVGWNDSGSLTINNSQNSGEIRGNGIQTGGFVGWNGAPLYMYGCVNNGAISNNGATNKNSEGNITTILAEIGGFVGASGGTITIDDYDNNGTIVHSQNIGNISSNGNVAGGFIGYSNGNVIIQNASNSGNVTTLGNYGDVPAGGFIGYIANGKTSITNSLNSGIVNSASHRVGGLIGASYDNTFVTIDSSTNTGNVFGTYEVGGFIGYASGNTTIQNSSKNTGTVSGGDHIAGILGSFNNTTKTLAISDTQNYGNVVSTGANAAGFVGSILSSASVTVKDCLNGYAILAEGQTQAAISATWNSVGGFVGACQSALEISDSQNHANINAYDVGGGLVGYAGNGVVTITNCINSGDLSFTSYRVGGIIGGAYDDAPVTIDNTINIGNILGTSEIGGFIGYGSGNVTIQNNSQNTGTVSGGDQVAGIIGAFNNGSNTLSISYTYNHGNVISTGSQVGGFVGSIISAASAKIENCSNGYATLAEGQVQPSIKVTWNSAAGFVGACHSILSISNSQNYANINAADVGGGFVGYADNGAITIINCLNAGNLPFSANRVGGIIGGAYTNAPVTISETSNSGNLSGTYEVGGFIGYACGNVSISQNCENSGEIKCTLYDNIGGFVGKFEYANGELIIRDSINSGKINAIAIAGGFVGNVNGAKVVTISNSTNSGTVVGSGNNMGGFIGLIAAATEINLSDCTNSGAVETTAVGAGGLVGQAVGNITLTNCSNTGTIMAGSTTATSNNGSADLYVGYMVGQITGTVTEK